MARPAVDEVHAMLGKQSKTQQLAHVMMGTREADVRSNARLTSSGIYAQELENASFERAPLGMKVLNAPASLAVSITIAILHARATQLMGQCAAAMVNAISDKTLIIMAMYVWRLVVHARMATLATTASMGAPRLQATQTTVQGTVSASCKVVLQFVNVHLGGLEETATSGSVVRCNPSSTRIFRSVLVKLDLLVVLERAAVPTVSGMLQSRCCSKKIR